MNLSVVEAEHGRHAPKSANPILDPRLGDMENDHSATKQRSLLAIAGSLLAEISLPKLLFAWATSILMPAVLLGLAPLALTAWIGHASDRLAEATGIGAVIAIMAALAVAWIGWRPLFRLAETNFWSLNALAVQPGYALWREALRHLIERTLSSRSGAALSRLRALSCAAAGILLFAVAALVALVTWPETRWVGRVGDLASPHLLIFPTIANTIVVMSAYLAVAALVWGFADATADQPLDSRRSTPQISGRASGAWPISPTCMSSASAMAFASRADAPDRAATESSFAPWSGSRPCTLRSLSTSCSSAAT